MTTVEILIPFYGSFERLQETVCSVLTQDDPQWRLTVVDDADPGGPRHVWFDALGDERVRYLRNEANLGTTGNFQRCLDVSRAELIVLAGCDDVLRPNYVSTVRAAAASRPGAAMIQPGVQVIDAAGRSTRTLPDEVKKRVYAPRRSDPHELVGEELAVSLLRGNWLYFPALAWRRDVVSQVRFRGELKTIQDLALILELVLAGESLLVVPTVCFSYRRHAASESSWRAATGTRFEEERRFFEEAAERTAAAGWPRAARAARWHVSSRLNALSLLPAAVRARQRAAVRSLARHVIGGLTRPPT